MYLAPLPQLNRQKVIINALSLLTSFRKTLQILTEFINGKDDDVNEEADQMESK